MATYNNVNGYFKTIKEPALSRLKKLREDLHAILPGGEDMISYQMPAIRYKEKSFIAYAAFKNHYSIFPMSRAVPAKLKKELAGYEQTKGSIHFPLDKQVPLPLLKKIVKTRMEELKLTEKTKKAKVQDKETDDVAVFMLALDHPLKKEIEAVRKIIKSSDKRLRERVKWNAPSYYFIEDLVTFNPRDQNRVHLVFHHKAIVNIDSGLLEGDYKDRRMTYFISMKEINAGKKELIRIMQSLIAELDDKQAS